MVILSGKLRCRHGLSDNRELSRHRALRGNASILYLMIRWYQFPPEYGNLPCCLFLLSGCSQ